MTQRTFRLSAGLLLLATLGGAALFGIELAIGAAESAPLPGSVGVLAGTGFLVLTAIRR